MASRNGANRLKMRGETTMNMTFSETNTTISPSPASMLNMSNNTPLRSVSWTVWGRLNRSEKKKRKDCAEKHPHLLTSVCLGSGNDYNVNILAVLLLSINWVGFLDLWLVFLSFIHFHIVCPYLQRWCWCLSFNVCLLSLLDCKRFERWAERVPVWSRDRRDFQVITPQYSVILSLTNSFAQSEIQRRKIIAEVR